MRIAQNQPETKVCLNVLGCSAILLAYLYAISSVYRNMWKAVSVPLVVMDTTHWSGETHWDVYHAYVTSMVLCQTGCAMSGADSAHAERELRAHSVPIVPPTTTTGVETLRVREVRESSNRGDPVSPMMICAEHLHLDLIAVLKKNHDTPK